MKKRTEKRKEITKEAKEDKKDLKDILSHLVEAYTTERAALEASVKVLLDLAAHSHTLLEFNAPVAPQLLKCIPQEIMKFIDYDPTEDRNDTGSVQVSKETKKTIDP